MVSLEGSFLAGCLSPPSVLGFSFFGAKVRRQKKSLTILMDCERCKIGFNDV